MSWLLLQSITVVFCGKLRLLRSASFKFLSRSVTTPVLLQASCCRLLMLLEVCLESPGSALDFCEPKQLPIASGARKLDKNQVAAGPVTAQPYGKLLPFMPYQTLSSYTTLRLLERAGLLSPQD